MVTATISFFSFLLFLDVVKGQLAVGVYEGSRSVRFQPPESLNGPSSGIQDHMLTWLLFVCECSGWQDSLPAKHIKLHRATAAKAKNGVINQPLAAALAL